MAAQGKALGRCTYIRVTFPVVLKTVSEDNHAPPVSSLPTRAKRRSNPIHSSSSRASSGRSRTWITQAPSASERFKICTMGPDRNRFRLQRRVPLETTSPPSAWRSRRTWRLRRNTSCRNSETSSGLTSTYCGQDEQCDQCSAGGD